MSLQLCELEPHVYYKDLSGWTSPSFQRFTWIMRHTCTFCNHSFPHKSSLLAHELLHLLWHFGKFVCRVCAQCFDSARRLGAHLSTRHHQQQMLTAASLPDVQQLRRQHFAESIQNETASHLQGLLSEIPITEEDLSTQGASPEVTADGNTLSQATSPVCCGSVADHWPDCPTIETLYPDIDLEDIFQSLGILRWICPMDPPPPPRMKRSQSNTRLHLNPWLSYLSALLGDNSLSSGQPISEVGNACPLGLSTSLASATLQDASAGSGSDWAPTPLPRPPV